jgi:hypothetical protein
MQALLPVVLPLAPELVPTDLPTGISVGTPVGNGRIPYGHAHPDCWGRPWQGVVLALDDVEAWTGTLAFDGKPSQEAATAHVRWCLAQGLLRGKVPVKWEFGKVMWERPDTLRTAEADVAAFEAAREAARR